MKFFSFDTFRALSLVPATLTFVGAIANLVISGLVLKPFPSSWKEWWGSGAGFHWLHIWAVTIGFQLFVGDVMRDVYLLIGKPPTHKAYLLWVGSSLLVAGYFIIFRIELARLRFKRAGLTGAG